jgi:hypothetical protein
MENLTQVPGQRRTIVTMEISQTRMAAALYAKLSQVGLALVARSPQPTNALRNVVME